MGIFNWDETGYQVGQGKRQKIIAPNGANANPTGGQNELITGVAIGDGPLNCLATRRRSEVIWTGLPPSAFMESTFEPTGRDG